MLYGQSYPNPFMGSVHCNEMAWKELRTRIETTVKVDE